MSHTESCFKFCLHGNTFYIFPNKKIQTVQTDTQRATVCLIWMQIMVLMFFGKRQNHEGASNDDLVEDQEILALHEWPDGVATCLTPILPLPQCNTKMFSFLKTKVCVCELFLFSLQRLIIAQLTQPDRATFIFFFSALRVDQLETLLRQRQILR